MTARSAHHTYLVLEIGGGQGTCRSFRLLHDTEREGGMRDNVSLYVYPLPTEHK